MKKVRRRVLKRKVPRRVLKRKVEESSEEESTEESENESSEESTEEAAVAVMKVKTKRTSSQRKGRSGNQETSVACHEEEGQGTRAVKILKAQQGG